MNEVHQAYNNLVAEVFHKAYDDLVEEIRRKKAAEQKLKKAPSATLADDCRKKTQSIQSSIDHLERWIWIAMPQWLDIDPGKFVGWAHREAETEKVWRKT